MTNQELLADLEGFQATLSAAGATLAAMQAQLDAITARLTKEMNGESELEFPHIETMGQTDDDDD